MTWKRERVTIIQLISFFKFFLKITYLFGRKRERESLSRGSGRQSQREREKQAPC